MPYVDTPADYELVPGDEIEVTVGFGMLYWWGMYPSVELVEHAVSWSSKYEFQSAAWEGSDLKLYLKILPPPEGEPEIIQAGAIPAVIINLLLIAGIGLIGFLIIKNVRVKMGPGGIEIETETSSGVMTLALLSLGAFLLIQRK